MTKIPVKYVAGGIGGAGAAAILIASIAVSGSPPEATPDAGVEATQPTAKSLMTDLLSPEVDPGAQVETTVTLPEGDHLLGAVNLIGESVGSFTLDSVEYVQVTNGTRLVVRATNTSQTRRRLKAIIEYGH